MSLDWQKDAACAGQPTNIFFPPDAADGEEYPANVRRNALAKAMRESKKFCDICVVSQECLKYATENDEVGIWAGTTQRQRNLSLAAEKRTAARNVPGMETHGTQKDYMRHLRLNSVPCAECRRAHARYVADLRRRKAAKAANIG